MSDASDVVGIKFTKKSLEDQGNCAYDGGVQIRHGVSIEAKGMGLEHGKGIKMSIKPDLSPSYGAGSEIRP